MRLRDRQPVAVDVGQPVASGVMPTRWNSAVEPKLAIAAPKCFSSSEPGAPVEPFDDRHRQ